MWCKSYKIDGTAPTVLSRVVAHLPYSVGDKKTVDNGVG